MTETSMCWGISCGDGWFNLIYELSKKITEIQPNAMADQVKEKYGALRFYMHTFNDEVEDLISEFETKSLNVCENCGSDKNVKQTKGWIITLCDDCMEKRNKGKI